MSLKKKSNPLRRKKNQASTHNLKMDEDSELLQIFSGFCENMGLDTRDVNFNMLADPEFYVAAFKHLFPNFEILIDDDPIQ